ncbi:MAG: histidine kinase [Desulfococcus sp. 4484_242]|nr:MAG: histidine kinase [Desulfococcus sp. 4484_242]
MWNRMTLRTRAYLLLSALVLVTFGGGSVMVWYTYRMQNILGNIIDRNMEAFRSAGALQVALINQKGFLSYYFLDGDPDWLRQLGEYRQAFKERLSVARGFVETDRQRETLDRLESEYVQYTAIKDRVISYYTEGDRAAGAELHKKIRHRFFDLLNLCEEYKKLHAARIEELREKSHNEAYRLRIMAGTAMVAVLFFGILLAFLLVHHILSPLRRLSVEAGGKGGADDQGDEVSRLSQSVRGLILNVDHTQTELEKSRETLLQAEKMASVGKLAAGMAHSIRNPLTSVKMRLFSLGRSLQLSETQRDDFSVISEEIRHIDTIVQNFLEFSRPPKLKMQWVSPSEVVDLVLELLRHRLESYNVEVSVRREYGPLPEVQGDPEQLKEVLVNLVENACEAMHGGGAIVITEEEIREGPLDSTVVIRVADNGPGIKEAILGKVMQPFFTTKEEGTGLGLSIARRIIEEHGGTLAVESQEGAGAVFVITLPIHPVSGG